MNIFCIRSPLNYIVCCVFLIDSACILHANVKHCGVQNVLFYVKDISKHFKAFQNISKHIHFLRLLCFAKGQTMGPSLLPFSPNPQQEFTR